MTEIPFISWHHVLHKDFLHGLRLVHCSCPQSQLGVYSVGSKAPFNGPQFPIHSSLPFRFPTSSFCFTAFFFSLLPPPSPSSLFAYFFPFHKLLLRSSSCVLPWLRFKKVRNKTQDFISYRLLECWSVVWL